MRTIVYALVVLLLGLIAPPAAFAYDDVVGTSPSNGDRLTAVPDKVRIDLTERPRSGSATVTGPSGRALRSGKTKLEQAPW